MEYNFTKIIERRGKDATAYDGIGTNRWGTEPKAAKPGFDEIPMWVADMNFETCPAITEALAQRIRHPLYGYFIPSDEYFESILNWQRTRHGWKNLSREMIGYENGVHGGIVTALEVLTQPAEAILVHSPAYVGFLEDLEDTGRKTVLSPLRPDENGIWRMDFDDMEKKIKEEHIHLAIFCSPHNPSGRVWERWEIETAMALFKKYDVIVVSDEIWSDIVFEGYRHIPAASVSEDAASRTITFYAPSKTFNLSGLVGSYHIIPNPFLRERITRYGSATRYNEMNVLSMHALIGAYSREGQEWTNQLNQVLEQNCRYFADFLNKIDGVHVCLPQGTYMLFADVGGYLKAHSMTLKELIEKGWDVGVAWQDGTNFAWNDAIRINTASPRSRLEEAADRLRKYVFT